MPPLMAIEFLCRVADVVSDYLGGELNDDLIKDNFVIVYEVKSCTAFRLKYFRSGLESDECLIFVLTFSFWMR